MAKTLIWFSAPWCKPCEQLSPIMETLSSDYPYDKVDVDQRPDIAQEWNVRALPTLVLVENSTELARVVGLKTEKELREFIDAHSYEEWVKINGEKPVLVEG